MCELLAMSSLCPTQLTLSLATLASHGRPDGISHDGWGAAFYQGTDVALFREPGAAGASPLVRFLEAQGPRTTLALSHIRHATRGAVALANTQPFQREVQGRMHVFAHNGDLPQIVQAAALGRYHPVGTTDSEHAMCALLERVSALWRTDADAPSLESRLEVIAPFAAQLRALGPANFLYADGDALFVHAHRRMQASGRIEPPGLHLLSRHCHDPGRAIDLHGACIGAGFQEVALVASVPLSAEPWQALPAGTVLAIRAGRVVAMLQP